MARMKGSKNKKAQTVQIQKPVETAPQEDNGQHKGTMTVAEAGQKGGTTVAEKYGTDFYTEIGSIGGTIRGLRNEEREIRNKAWEENKLPESYKTLVNEVYSKTQLFRLMARDYIPRMFKTLKENGFDDLTAKAITFWDASQIWTERRVQQVFAEHPELKQTLDARKQAAGQLGGEATAQRIAEASAAKDAIVSGETPTVTPASTSPNLSEASRPAGSYTGSGKKETETEPISSIRVNITKHETALMEALFTAHNLGSTYIEIDFNEDGEATGFRPVPPEGQQTPVREITPATAPA